MFQTESEAVLETSVPGVSRLHSPFITPHFCTLHKPEHNKHTEPPTSTIQPWSGLAWRWGGGAGNYGVGFKGQSAN